MPSDERKNVGNTSSNTVAKEKVPVSVQPTAKVGKLPQLLMAFLMGATHAYLHALILGLLRSQYSRNLDESMVVFGQWHADWGGGGEEPLFLGRIQYSH